MIRYHRIKRSIADNSAGTDPDRIPAEHIIQAAVLPFCHLISPAVNHMVHGRAVIFLRCQNIAVQPPCFPDAVIAFARYCRRAVKISQKPDIFPAGTGLTVPTALQTGLPHRPTSPCERYKTRCPDLPPCGCPAPAWSSSNDNRRSG